MTAVELFDVFVTGLDGLLDVTLQEIKELIDKDGVITHGTVYVDNLSAGEIATLACYARSIGRVCIRLGIATYDHKSTTLTMHENSTSYLQALINKPMTCAVATIKQRDVGMATPDLSAGLGAELFTRFESQEIPLTVQLKKPELFIHNYVTTDRMVFGIDVIGFDMTKRPYKVINTPSSLNGAFAYTILRKVGVEKCTCIVDPFCHDGILMIEAALHATNRSVFHYEHTFTGLRLPLLDEAFKTVTSSLSDRVTQSKQRIYAYASMLKTIKGMQKNAKIAGVHSDITSSKVSIDWIDAKFDEGEVDMLFTYPPQVSKRSQNVKEIKKIYDDLFYQAKYLLGNAGKLIMLMHGQNSIDDQLLEQYTFKIDSTKKVHSGGQEFVVYTITKK